MFIKTIEFEFNPRTTLWFFNQWLGRLEICPKCQEFWLTARNDMCVNCYLKMLDKYEKMSRKINVGTY